MKNRPATKKCDDYKRNLREKINENCIYYYQGKMYFLLSTCMYLNEWKWKLHCAQSATTTTKALCKRS